MAPLAPGQSVAVKFIWKAQMGTSTFGALVDSLEEVEEDDEANKRLVVDFGGTFLSDLTIDALSWSLRSPSSEKDEQVTFTLAVKNRDAGIAGPFRVFVYLDTKTTPQWDIPFASMAPDERVPTTFSWTAVAGTHVFRVVVDAQEKVVESDESNNSATANLTPK